MLKRGSSEYHTLLTQGYPEDMILLALNESKSKSFDNVVDLLHFREKHYKKTLATGKLADQSDKSTIINKKNLKDESKQKASEDKNDKFEQSLLENPIEVTQLVFGQQPQKAALRLDKKGQDIYIAQSNLLEQRNEKKPAEAPKGKEKGKFDDKEEKNKTAKKKGQREKTTNQGMEEDLVVFIETMIVDLTKEGIDDPSECLIKLVSYFKQISSEETPTMRSLKRHFSLWGEPPLIQGLQNTIFSLLNRILTTKTNENVDQNRLEYCLEWAFRMRLLSRNQMRSLKATCKKFYKAKHLDYTDISETLDKCYEDYDWGEPPRWYVPVEPKNEEYEEEKINEKQKEKLIAKARAKEKRREMQEQREKADEERKYQLVSKLNQKKCETFEEEFEADESSSENEVEVEVEKVEKVEPAKAKGMEECLICMGNLREIVFLPCCHFLTCSACSSKVDKCPLCSKGIEQNQKIYWS